MQQNRHVALNPRSCTVVRWYLRGALLFVPQAAHELDAQQWLQRRSGRDMMVQSWLVSLRQLIVAFLAHARLPLPQSRDSIVRQHWTLHSAVLLRKVGRGCMQSGSFLFLHP
jgi:hypothetical protein